MPLPPYLKVQNDVVLLHVKVQPRASRNEIGEVLGQQLKVKIAAPPVESAANEALVRFLSDVLDCPRHAVTLVRGGSSRHKVVALRGIPAESIEAKLVSAK
jgi:uncharacterized protein (TIGR00251 family)